MLRFGRHAALWQGVQSLGDRGEKRCAEGVFPLCEHSYLLLTYLKISRGSDAPY